MTCLFHMKSFDSRTIKCYIICGYDLTIFLLKSLVFVFRISGTKIFCYQFLKVLFLLITYKALQSNLNLNQNNIGNQMGKIQQIFIDHLVETQASKLLFLVSVSF